MAMASNVRKLACDLGILERRGGTEYSTSWLKNVMTGREVVMAFILVANAWWGTSGYFE